MSILDVGWGPEYASENILDQNFFSIEIFCESLRWNRLTSYPYLPQESQAIPVICKEPYDKSLGFSKPSAWAMGAVSSIPVNMVPLTSAVKYIKTLSW